MSEATIIGAVATALEPAAAQLLEQLHADFSAEITRLEAEMPSRLDAADAEVKYWVGDAKTVLHKLVAKLDVARGGASTVPPTPPAGSSAPAATTPASASTAPPASSSSPAAATTRATSASSSTPTAPNASQPSSPAGTAAPADGKTGA